MGKLILKCGNIVADELLEKVDAIVNPTNPMMKFGSGVCGAIFKKAGVAELELYTEETFGLSFTNPSKTQEMHVTEIRVTPGFALPCDIIFAQGPKKFLYADDKEAINLLLQTYKNICNIAVKSRYKSILCPALGTGHYGFTHEETAESVMKCLKTFIGESSLVIYFVIDSPKSLLFYNKFL